jgi:hypothetical protein
MKDYYVNKNQQDNGDHEVHQSDCRYMPNVENCIYLGTFNNCHDAVRAAKKKYSTANGCFWCCRECHTS